MKIILKYFKNSQNILYLYENQLILLSKSCHSI
jgi:hypothetical protein